MRIAIDGRCLNDLDPSLGRYLYNLLRALPRIADDVEISVFTGADAAANDSSRFDLQALEALGIELVPISAPLRGDRKQAELANRLRELEAAVFHAPCLLPGIKIGSPMVAGIYDTIDVSSASPASLSGMLTAKLGTRQKQRAVAAADAIITLSRAAQKDIVEAYGVPLEKVAVTPVAPSPELAPADADAVDELRSRLQLPERYVLHVGTNRPYENLETLMEAWSEVRGFKLSRCGLVLAGVHDSGGFNVREAGKRLGFDDLRALGAVAEADLPALYSGALFLVLPPLVEGFGLAVLEAMACGTPVACSRASSLPEVAAHAAVYFDPGDSGSIAQTLTRLLRNPGYRGMLTDRGLARAAQLSWQLTARLTLDVYRRAASGTLP